MTQDRPRLLLVENGSLEPAARKALERTFDVTGVTTPKELRELEESSPGALVLTTASSRLAGKACPDPTMIEHVAEGVGVVDHEGNMQWCDERLRQYGEEMLTLFIDHCVQGLQHFNAPERRDIPWNERNSREFAFHTSQHHYELVVSPSSESSDDPGEVASVVGILWENTATRRFQTQIDAIDAAGADLLHIEPGMIQDLTMTERLKLLEERIVHHVHNVLKFDNFEIRLIDRRSNRLELVIAEGLSPLKIGEVIFAEEEGNGISGWVAALGKSYMCSDVSKDPMYRDGLDDAASALTVPLNMNDKTIGVFNVESQQKHAFDDNDLLFAQLFGRYIAMAMNILDLLVVERSTTNRKVSQNIVNELGDPIDTLIELSEALLTEDSLDELCRDKASDIAAKAKRLRDRLGSVSSGPSSILDAEKELHRDEPDERFSGKRILVADDDEEIRNGLNRILTQRGCQVTTCANGKECIDLLEASYQESAHYNVVLSDIMMPDRNGYEVYRAARELDEELPVILMTGFGYDPHHSIVRCSQEGLHTVLFKPFKAGQMIEAVCKAFESTAAS